VSTRGEQTPLNTFRTGPDERGHFGIYGGRFVAETLMPLILDLERAYNEAKADPAFQTEMDRHLAHFRRPAVAALFRRAADRAFGGAKIYFKREDLNHTGAHKVNNVLGQIMLAMRMGKTRIIAETGAGMHGVATATLCAKFGLPCIVYMGAVDVERQQPNVLRMKMLGAEVRAVESGSSTLKDAMNDALRDWVANVADTFYCIGTVAGPHPYPAMVRDFQCIIGRETRAQMLGRRPAAGFADRLHRGRLQRHGPVPSLPRRAGDRDLRRRSGRARHPLSGSTRPRWPAAGRACCTAIAPIC
jgi:tryptophan synthase beta chain